MELVKTGGIPWTGERLRQEAAKIADELLRRKLDTPDQGITWAGPVGYGTENNPLQVRQLSPHLYNGTAGIALFLAALSRLDAGTAYGEASLETLAPLRRKLRALAADPDRAEHLTMSVGGLIGLGSFIYVFLRVGKLLDQSALIREAHAITVLMTPERIARDQRVRIQTGSAGALLALLALHDRLPEANALGATPLDLANHCGEHVAATRVSVDGRPPAWPLSPGKPPLADYCYGAAGIGYALMRLNALSPRPSFWQAGQDGLAFVQGLYEKEHENWYDIRALYEERYRPREGSWKDWWFSGTLEDVAPRTGERSFAAIDPEAEKAGPVRNRFNDMWCHGAVGIALGRLGALDLADSPAIRGEIAGVLARAPNWIRGAKNLDSSGADDLCCGHMGRAELLIEAGRKLGEDGHRHAAQELVVEVWRRAQRRGGCGGGYVLSAARGSDIFTPGLFQGLAGIGYTMLRLAEPEVVPCVLLLE